MRFKKLRGVNLPYNKQGLIYFTCMTVKEQPYEVQQKILKLCIEVAEGHYRALYEALTTDSETFDTIARKHFTNEKKLYSLRKRFFEKW